MTQPTPNTQDQISIHILSHMGNPNGWCMTSIMADIGKLTAQGIIGGGTTIDAIAQNMRYTRERIIEKTGANKWIN